ncbi:hypothetical protein LguiA_032889 [Lonicera macranthoides]
MYEEYMNNKFSNVAIMYVMFIVLCLILPPFFIFKFIYTLINSNFCSNHNKDLRGKVVLITGASSGIGEYMAYEYAKEGACLVLVARREGELGVVAEKARGLGSPQVLVICADVSNVNDCKRFIDQTIDHFGRLDHLVNNAGIGANSSIDMDVTKFAPVMDINFWGSVYPTHFAIPHLKKSKGNIVVNSSSTALLNPPKSGFYGASKAALVSFYEAMRIELAPQGVRVTIVMPGFIDSEMIRGKHFTKEGVVRINTKLGDAVAKLFPVMSTEPCAKAIVEGTCKGERYISEPQFVRVLFLLKFLCPELMDLYYTKLHPRAPPRTTTPRNKIH